MTSSFYLDQFISGVRAAASTELEGIVAEEIKEAQKRVAARVPELLGRFAVVTSNHFDHSRMANRVEFTFKIEDVAK